MMDSKLKCVFQMPTESQSPVMYFLSMYFVLSQKHTTNPMINYSIKNAAPLFEKALRYSSNLS